MTETPADPQVNITEDIYAAKAALMEEERKRKTSGNQLFPSMATYPLPGIYDPPNGGERAQGKRQPLKAGDAIVVLDKGEGSQVIVCDTSGNLWTIPAMEVRIMVNIPWVGPLAEAAIGFALSIDPSKANPPGMLVPDKRLVTPDGRRIG